MAVDLALLRLGLASALCAAQTLPLPRSPMDHMIGNLLRAAFDMLDEASHMPRDLALRIAAHALAEWRALYVEGPALAFVNGRA